MYTKLNEYLQEFSKEDYAVDYWYDVGSDFATGLISKFSESDWKDLFAELPNKPVMWQQRLAYCLEDNTDTNQFAALIKMTDTTDKELFEICVDSLRGFINDDNKQILLKNSKLNERITMLKDSSGDAVKMMFSDYLRKIDIT